MADYFEIRVAALDAAIALHGSDASADDVLAVAEKFLPFLNGGVPVLSPIGDVPPLVFEEAPAETSAAPVVQDNSASAA